MVDVEKIVREQAEKMKNIPEGQKQNAIDAMTAFGNFMNCIWSNSERKSNGQSG